VISSGQGLSLLIDNLRDGMPVIIDVLSNFSTSRLRSRPSTCSS
jgi:hypothetical protein